MSELKGVGAEIKTVRGKFKYAAVLAGIAFFIFLVSMISHFQYGVYNPISIIMGYEKILTLNTEVDKIQSYPTDVYITGSNKLDEFMKKGGWAPVTVSSGIHKFEKGGKTCEVIIKTTNYFNLWIISYS